MNRCVIIVAGGKGLRMGGALPKQFVPIAGKPILMHTLEVFYKWDPSTRLILVLPEDHQSYWKMLCKEIGCVAPHDIVNGGITRFESVNNGLSFIRDNISDKENLLVGVHDGVRPFVSSSVLDICFDEAFRSGSAVPAVSVIDSLREKTADGSHAVDRSRFVAVQTPQVFRYEPLMKSYEHDYVESFTDDASVVEYAGFEIHLVEGNRENIKITTPMDLALASCLLNDCNK